MRGSEEGICGLRGSEEGTAGSRWALCAVMDKSLAARMADIKLQPQPREPPMKMPADLDDIKYPAFEDIVSDEAEADDIMARINAQNVEKDREEAERAATPRYDAIITAGPNRVEPVCCACAGASTEIQRSSPLCSAARSR